MVSFLAKWILSLGKSFLKKKKGIYLVGRAFWLKYSQLGLPFIADLGREGGQGWTLTVLQTWIIPRQPKSSSFPDHLWNHGPQSLGQKWSSHRDRRKEDVATTIQNLKTSLHLLQKEEKPEFVCIFHMFCFASLGIKAIPLVLHRRNSFCFFFFV